MTYIINNENGAVLISQKEDGRLTLKITKGGDGIAAEVDKIFSKASKEDRSSTSWVLNVLNKLCEKEEWTLIAY